MYYIAFDNKIMSKTVVNIKKADQNRENQCYRTNLKKVNFSARHAQVNGGIKLCNFYTIYFCTFNEKNLLL